MSFFKKIIAHNKVQAAINNMKAAEDCVTYILDSEHDDFKEYAQDQGITKSNWPEKWHTVKHIYVSALQAFGKTPSEDDFIE
jgi:hypothetical protein